MIKSEPNFIDFHKNKNSLKEWLINFKFKGERDFFTYKKLKNLESSAKEYFDDIKKVLPDFDFSDEKDMIDIGAHHGSVSIYAATLGANVVAYEPNPINYEILNINIKANSDLMVESYNNAVGQNAGNLPFNFGETSTTGSMLNVGRDWKRTDNTINVNIIGINDILSKFNNIKLLKMDCEGCEYGVFESISNDNFNKVEVFYVEVHPTKHNKISDFENIMKNKKCRYVKKEVAHGCYEFICSNNIGQFR